MPRKVIYFGDNHLDLFDHLSKMENPSEYVRQLIFNDIYAAKPLTRTELEAVLKKYLSNTVVQTEQKEVIKLPSAEDVNTIFGL